MKKKHKYTKKVQSKHKQIEEEKIDKWIRTH